MLGKAKKITLGIAIYSLFAVAGMLFFACKKQPPSVWYVEAGLEDTWARILRAAEPPEAFAEIRVWDNGEIPDGPGILIATNLWKTEERAKVYYRLSWDLEYQDAIVLALDPWMIFRKHMNPALSFNRVMSGTGGSGLLLIPGRDIEAVRAWTGRFIQEEPGRFPSNEVWQEWEQTLFSRNLFNQNMQGFDWHAVLFRLMGNEPAWLYAPLSTIRRYRDPHKSILEATPFPERGGQSSLQVNLLWALPLKSNFAKSNTEIENTIAWLKRPDIQTIIADTLEWIPADPYGTPYDPVSLTSHRVWLTTPWIYTLNK